MSTRLKLSAHGAYFAKELRNLRTSIPPNLAFNCLDGQIKCHKDVFAAQMDKASMLYKLLKSHTSPDDYLVTISLPDVLKSDFILLLDLLYTGQFNIFADCEDHLSRLQDLTTFLRINVEAALAFDDIEADFFQPQPELSVETIPLPAKKKSVHLAKQPTDFVKPGDDESASIRRSKRPRTKNKLLDDFETASKIVCEENAIITANALSQEPMDEETKTPKQVVIGDVAVKVTEPDVAALEVHSEAAEVSADVVRACLVCKKKLFGQSALSKHLLAAHGKPLACPECGKAFANGRKLHDHLRRTHAKAAAKRQRQREIFRCTAAECTSAEFQSFGAFRSHTLQAHGVFPLECAVCGRRYKERATFRNHVETHQGEARYTCDVCPKAFVTKERLFAHRRLHLGRRFGCTKCDFRGRSTAALRAHIGMRHAERRFACAQCGKKFASKQNLDQHERVHTGAAPWACVPCNAAFKRHHHLRQHLSTAAHAKKANKPPLDDVVWHDTTLAVPDPGPSAFDAAPVNDDLINLADDTLFLDGVQWVIVQDDDILQSDRPDDLIINQPMG